MTNDYDIGASAFVQLLKNLRTASTAASRHNDAPLAFLESL
jgi:hypothetical protein